MKKLLIILVVLFTINSFGQELNRFTANAVIVDVQTDRVSTFEDYEIVIGRHAYGFFEVNSKDKLNDNVTILEVEDLSELNYNQFLTKFKEEQYKVLINNKTESSPYNSIIIFKYDKDLLYFETIYYLVDIKFIETFKL